MKPSDPHTYDYSGDSPDDRVVLCPWHGYKFRLSDGRSPLEGDRMRVRTYTVELEGDEIVIYT
jgi:3-phenylpropionate/trans-cinnamate dioxygenase ferredoxin subunit